MNMSAHPGSTNQKVRKMNWDKAKAIPVKDEFDEIFGDTDANDKPAKLILPRMKTIFKIKEHKIFKFLSGFATLTGSCLVDDMEPNDVDFFSKLEYEPFVREKLVEIGATKLQNGASLEQNWGKQVRYQLDMDGCKVELFFVEPKYHAVLLIVSGLIIRLCNDRLFRAVLKDKDARIKLYESVRNTTINREPKRPVKFDYPDDDLFGVSKTPPARKLDLG